MKTISLVACMVFLLLSIPSSAQDNSDDFHHEANQHEIFQQSNSLNGDVFDNHEIDNIFGSYRFLPNTQSIRYNRVDALFLGLGTDFTNPDSKVLSIGGLDFDGFIGYSTGQSDFQYKAGVTKTFGDNFRIGGEIINTTTSDDYWRTGLFENSITSLVAGYDYLDYYNAEGYGIYTELDIGKFIDLGGSYNHTLYSSSINNTGYSFFEGGNFGRINPLIDALSDNINQESIGFQLAINRKGYTRGIFTSKFVLRGELSDAGFNNDFSYNKFEVTTVNYLKLDGNTLLKVRTMAGSITGEAPDFKNFALGGIGSLRASGYKLYQGDRMLLNNAELIFGDFWEYENANLQMEGLYLSLFLDSGWTNFVNNNSNDPFSGFDSFRLNQLTHNIGAGLGTGTVRFEVATPVAGSEGFTSFWIRLNPTF